MTPLQADLEALMPEPDIRVDAFGEIHPTDRRTFVMGNFYTAAQVREALLAATERAAKQADQEEERECLFGEEHTKAVCRHIAAAIRGAAGGGQ